MQAVDEVAHVLAEVVTTATPKGEASREVSDKVAASLVVRCDRSQVWEQLEGDLVRVEVDAVRYDLPESLVDEIQQAPKARGVVLAPANDPYLRQVDRTLLVPDRQRRQKVYRALSGPGALLVDGEVVGTWRYRRSESQVTIEPFDGLTSARKTAAERSARTLARSTGEAKPSVTWS